MSLWSKRKIIVTRPTPAPPALTFEEDRELDVLVQKLIYFEDVNKSMTKKTKLYLKEMAALDKAISNLSSQFTGSSADTPIEDNTAINQASKMIQNAESLYQTTFIEPLKAFREFFAQAEESLKKREELVEKWKALHIQVQNLQGKKYKLASHTVKLELDSRSEEISAQELKAYHAELIQLLDSVIKNRLQGIRPCVHALIMNQLDYYGNITSSRHAFGQTTTHNEEKKPTASQLESEFKNNITTELNRIKGLTIVKDH